MSWAIIQKDWQGIDENDAGLQKTIPSLPGKIENKPQFEDGYAPADSNILPTINEGIWRGLSFWDARITPPHKPEPFDTVVDVPRDPPSL